MDSNITPEVLFFIGLVASIVVFICNEILKRTGKPLGRAWLTAILYVVAMIITLFIHPLAVPVPPILIGDPAQDSSAMLFYAMALLMLLSTEVGFATLIYNVLLKRVLDALADKYLPVVA